MVGCVLAKDEAGVRFSLPAPKKFSKMKQEVPQHAWKCVDNSVEMCIKDTIICLVGRSVIKNVCKNVCRIRVYEKDKNL